MNPILTGVIAFFVLLLLAAMAWWKCGRGPSLSASAQSRIRQQWERVLTRTDPHRRILDADTVLSSLLGELGFSGTTGEKLKKAGKYLPDKDAVWRAHKLRNQVAHEPDIQLDEARVAKAMRAFESVIRKFCA